MRHQTKSTPGILVKNMQMSLAFYTTSLGLKIIAQKHRGDGTIGHASVGFDSPLLTLTETAPEDASTTSALARQSAGSSTVDFLPGNDGANTFDAFISAVRAAGIMTVPPSSSAPGSERMFTVIDPDGNAISFGERMAVATPLPTSVNERQSRRTKRRRPFESIFNAR